MTGCRIYHHFLFLFPSCSFLTICFCCQLCIHNHIHFVYIYYTASHQFKDWILISSKEGQALSMNLCRNDIFNLNMEIDETYNKSWYFHPKTNISPVSLYFVLWLFTFPWIMYSLDLPGWLAWLPPGWCFRFRADSNSSQEFTNLPGFSPRIE